MRKLTSKHLVNELKKRVAEKKEQAEKPAFVLEDILFDKQLEFVNNNAPFRTAVCSRRAGKTIACAADLLHTILNTDRANCLYVAITRGSAKNIIWRELLNLNTDYELGLFFNNVELTVTNPKNSSIIYITGAKDDSEIEKLRGMSFHKIYIDEAQSHRSHIKTLVDDILIPSTWDVSGTIALIGTPGPVPAGYFYDMNHNPQNANFKWTILDNPHIKLKSGKEPAEILAAERARKGITENDPTYMREALGLWVKDENSLVFKFNKLRNYIDTDLPKNLFYIFGIDIGWNDADAIAVLGYDMQNNKCYLVEEHVKSKQTISELVSHIQALKSKYNPIKMVMDAGALGKKIQEEIRFRHGLHLEAAEKHRKHEFIELLNDDLRNGLFKAYPGSRFEQDADLVTWDYSVPEKPVISDRYHSDVCDSILYAHRECKHYIKNIKATEAPDVNTQEYMDMLADKYAEKLQKAARGDEDLSIDFELSSLYTD